MLKVFEGASTTLETIQANYDYVKEKLTKAYPQIVISPLEGTYLMWIDLSAVVDPAKLEIFIKNKADND